MSLSIQNSITNLSTLYKYNNSKKIQSTLTNKSENITKTTTSSVSNVCGVKYGEDPEQVLIEDKAIYDAMKDYPSLKNIEFGSDEWNQWKINNCNDFFPPLDAPASVRKAFREVKESIPNNDQKAKRRFSMCRAQIMFCKTNPELSGFKNNITLDSPRDYETLINFNINRMTNICTFCDPAEKEKLDSLIEFNQQIKNKLHENLFGL